MSEHIFETDGPSVVYVSEGMGLTNTTAAREEVVRCRDCGKSWDKGWRCRRFEEVAYDPESPCGLMFDDDAHVRPDGFCAWAERRGQ